MAQGNRGMQVRTEDGFLSVRMPGRRNRVPAGSKTQPVSILRLFNFRYPRGESV